MIRIFKTEDGTIHEKQEMQPGSWIALTNPTASEIMDVADACRIDPDHLKAPLDEEERSRIEAEDASSDYRGSKPCNRREGIRGAFIQGRHCRRRGRIDD